MHYRAERRRLRNKHIMRKKAICHAIYRDNWYEHDGQYSKNKIHCSCKLCKYGKHYNLPTIAEMKDKEIVSADMKDYETEYISA